ncbi:MAG: hypothetical protein IKA23_00035 [Akkermansia sp.]|nr:hypothetical protein [Akkermansia sp.]
MIKRLLTTSLLLALSAAAADYANLKDRFCDEQNRVIYDGAGRFTVKSPAVSELELTLDMAALESYLGSNDYKQGPLVTWEMSMPGGRKLVYGLADTAKHITCYWGDQPWEKDGTVSYEQLKTLAEGGKVKLQLTINPAQGISVSSGGRTLLTAPNLKTRLPFDTTHAYSVNTNYVTAVGIKAVSALDTAGYKAPEDYTKPFTRTRENSLGRIMFCGDSITHGVNDQTWRWQLFKTLVDNGVEAQIVGPRSGYTPGYTQLSTSDAGDSYAGVTFPNVHLAQSSGRTHNIISGSNSGMSGVNYGGHSTKSSAAAFNCDTWCCLMGTNDLLSDRGYTPKEFATKMQNLLGGKVTSKGKRYSWRAGKDWGNMGRIAADVLKEDSDVLYVMAVPCWGNHANNNEPERHLAVKQYNALLQEWVRKYAEAHDKKLVFVDVNRGMVSATHKIPFSWPDSMSNRPGRDGLHPNEQGSLIIANNLASAMGLPGRTAGLPRASADGWQNKVEELQVRGNVIIQEEPFSAEKGYSLEMSANMGKGQLLICLSDENGSGTLTLSRHDICWGDKPLYCFAADSPTAKKRAAKGKLRIVRHPGMDGTRPQGYYVWLDDQLIGQALPAGQPSGNGLQLRSRESSPRVRGLRYTEGCFAPEKP